MLSELPSLVHSSSNFSIKTNFFSHFFNCSLDINNFSIAVTIVWSSHMIFFKNISYLSLYNSSQNHGEISYKTASCCQQRGSNQTETGSALWPQIRYLGPGHPVTSRLQSVLTWYCGENKTKIEPNQYQCVKFLFLIEIMSDCSGGGYKSFAFIHSWINISMRLGTVDNMILPRLMLIPGDCLYIYQEWGCCGETGSYSW